MSTSSNGQAPILSTSLAVVQTQTDVSQKTLATTDPILARDAASNAAEDRHAIIAGAAYLRTKQRHFEPGHDVEDWLAAESALNSHRPPGYCAPSS